MELTEFWGLTFISEPLAEAVGRLLEIARTGQPTSIRLVNANSIAAAEADDRYRSILASDGINYSDGLPLAGCLSIIATLRRPRIRHRRIRGPSLFESTLAASQDSEVTHLFFGGDDVTIAALKCNIEAKFPGVKVAGCVSPPVAGPDELARLARDAHGTFGGHIVWIGLGQPKQDFVASLLAKEISAPCVGVGAAFNFMAGTVSTAPRWMQAVGMEWFFRLVQEPRRLWYRYTIGNFRFLRIAIAELRRAVRHAN